MFTKILRKLIYLFMIMPNSPFKKAVRDLFYGEVVTERIVEYSLVFANLPVKPSKKVKILDIGCYYSNFPISLASMGFSVTGVDLMDYEMTHPNFKFMKGDIVSLSLQAQSFDVVTCISTLEHIGLGVYGDKNDLAADKKVMQVIHSVLKKKGWIILTVPFGKRFINPSFKSYDSLGIKGLFNKKFKIQKMEFFRSANSKWLPASLKEMKSVSNKDKARGMAFIMGVKV